MQSEAAKIDQKQQDIVVLEKSEEQVQGQTNVESAGSGEQAKSATTDGSSPHVSDLQVRRLTKAGDSNLL